MQIGSGWCEGQNVFAFVEGLSDGPVEYLLRLGSLVKMPS
jgi:hypothetical protein